MEFYNKLLEHTDNQVFYLIPEYENDTLIDFEVQYNTNNVRDMLGINDNQQIEGELLSNIYPEAFQNGVLEILIAAYNKKDLSIKFERKVEQTKTNNYFWYAFKAVRIDNGICLISKEINALKNAQKNLKSVNSVLKFQNVILDEAEKIGKFASFQWKIGINQWFYSRNFKKLLDLNDTTDDSFPLFHYIGYEDKNRILSAIKNTEYYEDLKKQYFTIDSNGNIKHFSLTGHFLPDKSGQIMMGVIDDITSDIILQEELIEKNVALEKTNIELDSFNHIASHDLQEPLRKIQMFISRLLDTEKESLSSKGFNYLEKIEASASKMQNLIRHLLTYSRIGKEHSKLETINLNDVIEDILEDQSEQNRDRIVTHIDTLPEIEGIPFLIEQLFTNILSNAIKYQQVNTTIEIKITGVLTNEDITDTELDGIHNDHSFLKIIITDNGIGFETKHYDKIFEPFQRLHTNNEYKGTGIGLAICKKIVEAHKGQIVAKSKLGEGSNFTITLPIKQF